MNTNIDLFFEELIKLYEKYNLTISHEDGHGSFIIDNYNEFSIDWIKAAEIRTSGYLNKETLPF